MTGGGHGRGPKNVGMWYLLLLGLGLLGALGLAWYFELGRAATAATLLPSLASAFLAWKAFLHDRIEAAVIDLGTAADQLAEAVSNQWDAEAAVRRLNDPYPLPVAWQAADADLVQPWTLLADLARAWPGGPPSDPARWPAEASGLAGEYAEIGEVFAQRVPTRRLVVLGEPGSGKTMLLVRLLHSLISQRADCGPVPVLFSLASWNPAGQPLQDWLADQLRRSYPGLHAPAPPSAPQAGQVDLAQGLLDTRRILPLLDGFDELPPALHAMALDAINQTLPAKQPLVLVSRAAPYRDVMSDAQGRPLNGAAGIHLMPLTPAQAAAYLRHDAGGEHTPAADRWNTVAAHLGTDTPVGQALSTPLGLFLARTIYNPRPDTPAAPSPIRHPDELCDHTAFPTRTAVDTHLFNAYIPAAYTRYHPNPPRWSPSQAHRTLVFLARHLETHRNGSPDIAWWEFHHATPGYLPRLFGGLGVGLVGGVVAGVVGGLVAGVVGGLAAGVGVWLVAGVGVWLLHDSRDELPSTPSARLRRSFHSRAHRLGVGLGVWLAAGLALGLVGGLVQGLVVGLVIGLAAGLLLGVRTEEPDLTATVGPATSLTRDRRTLLTVVLALWLMFALVGGLVAGLVHGLGVGVAVGLVVGLPSALVGGVAIGLGDGIEDAPDGYLYAAWLGWVMAKLYLAVRYKVPWALMTFLQDAHEHRSVLRQAGAVYQFRHLDLQRHLAQQPWPPTA